jgi:chaperone required for assembly of F1-ATPase
VIINKIINTKKIKVSRGDVIGIGKIKIPKNEIFGYEIQHLSFIDIKNSETSFVSTCIDLRIDGYGDTIEEAENELIENIIYFLSKNFSILSPENAWENLKDLIKLDEWSIELWNAYNEVRNDKENTEVRTPDID